jgi:hypothetical protein
MPGPSNDRQRRHYDVIFSCHLGVSGVALLIAAEGLFRRFTGIALDPGGGVLMLVLLLLMLAGAPLGILVVGLSVRYKGAALLSVHWFARGRTLSGFGTRWVRQ